MVDVTTRFGPGTENEPTDANLPRASQENSCERGKAVEAVQVSPNRLVLSLVFGHGGNAANHQFGSWSHPENGFTWGLTPGCGLRLALAPSCEEVAILVDVQPAWISPERPSRRTVISLEGRVLLDLQISRRSTYYIALGSFPEGADIKLSFVFDEVPSLDEREIRPLALAFRKVLVIAQRDGISQHVAGQPNIPLPKETSSVLKAVVDRMGVSPETLVTAFESLGHSCDFGLFQRECGAEPLGLLRFGGISTPDLVEALVDRFSRLGTNVTAEPKADWLGEFMVVDQAYGLVSHTFVHEGQAAPEQLVQREFWRLPFLRGLFLEVLDGALKIFVLRRPGDVHVSEALAVAAVLRLYGENVLLWAVQEHGRLPGSIDIIANYLIRGHLDVTHGKGSASIQAWLSICMNTFLALGGKCRKVNGQLKLNERT